MPVVTGPLFSLKASGLLGKTILYYDTKYGARVRLVRKNFTPPGNIWEVNKEWFKKASDRWKFDLTSCMKLAWGAAYPGICDVARDIFMGHQIEAWNLSPLYDLLWPVVGVGDVGIITFGSIEYEGSVRCWYDEFSQTLIQRFGICAVWFRKLDDGSDPGESDIVKEGESYSASVDLISGYTNYVWGGIRHYNGALKFWLIGSFVR